jgi:hypothetical protein
MPRRLFYLASGSHPDRESIGLERSGHSSLQFVSDRSEIGGDSQRFGEVGQGSARIRVRSIETIFNRSLYPTSQRISQGRHTESRDGNGQITLHGRQLAEEKDKGCVHEKEKEG